MMKLVLSTITFLALHFLGCAQNPLVLPDSGAIWTNTYEMYETPIIGNDAEPIWSSVWYYCVNGLDTTISGQSYNQIHYCNSGYKGAFRQGNEAVYFIPKDSIHEYLLYDFGVEVGDSLYNVYRETPFGWNIEPFDLEVGAVDTQFVYGKNRKVVQFWDGLWIEGVGNRNGLFWDAWSNVSGIYLDLACFSHLDTSYTLGGYEVSNGSCSLDVGIYQGEYSHEKLTIYPNPGKGIFNLEIAGLESSRNATIFVIDNLGRTVHTETLIGSVVRMDLSGLESGIYTCVLMDGKFIYKAEVVILK